MKTKERIDEKTPNGGDYSEIYYLDENKKSCNKESATRVYIRECTAEGALVQETYGTIKRSVSCK